MNPSSRSNQLRLAFDARTVFSPHRRGTGKNLIDLYRKVAALRPHWQIIAYHRQPQITDALLPEPNITPKYIEMPGDRLHAWERFRLPFAAWGDGADVLHCPANTSPPWMPIPTVVTIHDLIPLDSPGETAAQERRYFNRAIHHACRSASWIICPSTFTKNRLVSEFNADPTRITVNHWAPDSQMTAVDRNLCRPVTLKYGVDRNFVLHFGAPDPRKNTRNLIEAWAMADHNVRANWQLLIVGLDPQTRSALKECATRLGLHASVILHGFTPESDLPSLLSAAGVLAYPSLAEGFGLPILDAWTAGACVLASDSTSIPEIAADAALLVDPTDRIAIARGLTRLIRDERLRKEFARKGKLRLAQFSWEETAQRFISTIQRVIDSRDSSWAAA